MSDIKIIPDELDKIYEHIEAIEDIIKLLKPKQQDNIRLATADQILKLKDDLVVKDLMILIYTYFKED